MAVSYSLNWMGPISLKWYTERGLTHIVKKVVTEDMRFYPKQLKVGDVWEYEEIAAHYACGRIDIRDSSKEGYDGWDEYGVRPMTAESWGALAAWSRSLKTEEVVEYSRLLEMFEEQTGHKIQWWEENACKNR